MKKEIIIAFFILTFVRCFLYSDGWIIREVDTYGDVGRYTSLDLDSSFYPHISYLDYNNENLKYAYWNGSTWVVQTVDSAGVVGKFTSLELDSSYLPHISYYDETNGNLKYAHFDGSSWNIEVVDSAGIVGSFTALTLDNSYYPHISYYNESGGDLKYARWNGSSWVLTTVESGGDVGRFTSIDLDSSFYPHISYWDVNNTSLKYAGWNGSSWQIETVDSDGEVGRFSSLKIDLVGHSHISYYDDANGNLKYALYDGSTWSVVNVDTIGDVGRFSSLNIDSLNNPHISYFNDSTANLLYAYWNGSNWLIDTVDFTGIVGKFTSIQIDASDMPHISYYNELLGDLKYAFYNLAPSEFNLLSPGDGGYVTDTPTMDWEDATDYVNNVTYDLWYADNTGFDPHYEVPSIGESTYTFPEGILVEGNTYYWKVRAWDGYEETWCNQPYWTFHVVYEDINLSSFTVVSKGDMALVLNWSVETTEGEVISGFNIYRREMGLEDDNDFIKNDMRSSVDKVDENWLRINDFLITGENPYEYIDTNVERGTTYEYKLEAIVGVKEETIGTKTGICGLPTSLEITSIYPNPADELLNVVFSLPEVSPLNVEIFDITGRLVMEKKVENITTVGYEMTLETSNLASGVYTLRASTPYSTASTRFVVTD